MQLCVGTSGWQYRDWRGAFYPVGVPVRSWLEYYAAQFPTVEVNAAFYRLPERAVFEAWRARTPAGFTVTVKASRFLTHVRRLRDPAEPVSRLMDRVAGLGEKAGPVLLQLPPTLPADPVLLGDTLACFPAGVPVAVEPREESWWSEQTCQVLTDHGAALVWADRLGRAVSPSMRTADWGYLRFHEDVGPPWPRYRSPVLARWAATVTAAWPGNERVYAYFNNDPGAAAPSDARRFAAIAYQALPGRRLCGESLPGSG